MFHLCCTGVASVALVLLVSGTRFVNWARSFTATLDVKKYLKEACLHQQACFIDLKYKTANVHHKLWEGATGGLL